MPNTANPQTPRPQKNQPVSTLAQSWLTLSIGAVLGAILSIAITDSYFPSMLTEIINLLGFIGPAAPFMPLIMLAIIGALFGAELAALILVGTAASENLTFLWNAILNFSAIAGASLGVFLALGLPTVFDFALRATHGAFPAVMPWIFMAGFGFVMNTFLAYLGYRGSMAVRNRKT